MDITGKVLREVEFRDRLRGYDTDEVDEFLEEVAVAVDELHRRLAETGNNRAAAGAPVAPLAPNRAPEAEPPIDDDSIRRTLVLAQRTADLAIREAREEASTILERARREAEDLVAQATENARRLREEADADFHTRVSQQRAQREQLEREVAGLTSAVGEERVRLSDALHSLLSFIETNLSVATEVAAEVFALDPPAPTVAAESSPSPAAPEVPLFVAIESEPLLELDVVDDEITFTAEIPVVAPSGEHPVRDQDEELWQRWANGGGFDEEEKPDESDPFGFNRR